MKTYDTIYPSRHPLFDTWRKIKLRCLNPSDKQYKNYGARGIKICDEWLNNFWNFASYVGKKPSKNHTLDRIDNNGNYQPGNVRWATVKEQNNNKRTCVFYEYNGERLNIKQWAKKLKIDDSTLYARIFFYNWSFEKAISEPIKKPTKINSIVANGESKTVSEWSKITGICRKAIYDRIKRGWPPEMAVSIGKIERNGNTCYYKKNKKDLYSITEAF